MTSRHPSDITARKTFLGEDDHRFREQRRRKRAPKDPLPELPDGPCCARCQNWHAPQEEDDFGGCREVVVAQAAYAENRIVMPRREAMERMLMGWDYLRTRGFFAGCSLFKERVTAERASTDVLIAPPSTALRDRIRSGRGETA